MHLPQPTFKSVGSMSAVDLEKFNAVVVPIYLGDGAPTLGTATLAGQNLSTMALAKCNQSCAEILADWPDFTGKAGEIIEIPLLRSGNLTRLFIVGFATGGIEDSRKAGAALGRKVKSTGYSIFSTFVAGYDEALAHIVALSLSQYGWSIKSDYSKSDKSARAKGAASFTFIETLSEAIERAVILADATWQTRDLIHTPSNIKNPAWLADQAKLLVRKAKS